MFRFVRQNRATIYGWFVMLAIPLLVMGWTAGKYGPGSDDWSLLYRLHTGNWVSWDLPRPFMLYFDLIIPWISSGDLATMEILYIFLEGINAALFFEVLRRLFRRWLGEAGAFPALLTALVYVLYPSYADRLWLIMLQDCINRVLTLAIALLWVIGSERDLPRYGFLATVMMLITVLHKENSILVFGLFPLIPLYFGRPIFQGKWRRTTALWFGAFIGYVIWHNLPARLGGIGDVQRTVNFLDIPGAISYLLNTLSIITVGAYDLAFGRALSQLQDTGSGWVLPASLLGGALIVAAGWLINRREVDAGLPGAGFKPWLWLCLFGLAELPLGLILFYFQLGRPINITSVESRHSSVAMLGISLIFGLVIMLPLLVTRMFPPPGSNQERTPASRATLWRYGGLLLTGLLSVALLTGGVIRQYRLNLAYIEAWEIQRAYWHRITELRFTVPTQSLIVMDSFPRFNEGAPLAAKSWGYENAFGLLYPDLPTDIMVINNREVSDVVIHGETVTFKRYKETLTYPFSHIRVLYYDAETASVDLSPHLPSNWVAGRVYIYTGDNLPQGPARLSDAGATLLGPPTAPGACRTRVPVSSGDTAPADGVVEVVMHPQNQVLDRRPVNQGDALDYSFMAPCGVWLRVYFVTQSPDRSISTEWLVSQYGADSDYGTAETEQSISYATTFQDALKAEPLH